MRRAPLLLALAFVAALLAPQALAAPGVTAVELAPGTTPRPVQSRGTPKRFSLVGIHWRGTGTVQLRTRSSDGRWSPWRSARPEGGDGPDPGSREAAPRAGWRIGSPWWVGPSDRLETRTTGRVSRVRAYLVWSPEPGVPYRVPAATSAPPIVPRLSWGASESRRSLSRAATVSHSSLPIVIGALKSIIASISARWTCSV